jgi:replication factor C subunit 1
VKVKEEDVQIIDKPPHVPPRPLQIPENYRQRIAKRKQEKLSRMNASMSLTERYRPRIPDELAGNGKTWRNVREWIQKRRATAHTARTTRAAQAQEHAETDTSKKQGKCKRKKPKKPTFGKCPVVCLLHGPPGTGKTTAAHLLLCLEGYDIMEYNASDTRSEKQVNNEVYEAALFRAPEGSRPRAIVMDEIDGMSEGDRGGLAALAKLTRDERILYSGIPFICICNEKSGKRLLEFSKQCKTFRIYAPFSSDIVRRLRTIAQSEGYLHDVLEKQIQLIANCCNGDVRKAVSMLEESFRQKGAGTPTASVDLKLDIFNATSALLNAFDEGKAKPCRRINGASMVQWKEVDTLANTDSEMMAMMVRENFTDFDAGRGGKGLDSYTLMERHAAALADMSDGDIMRAHTMRTHDWSLYPATTTMAVVAPALRVHGCSVQQAEGASRHFLRFPTEMGNISKERANLRKLTNTCPPQVSNHDFVTLYRPFLKSLDIDEDTWAQSHNRRSKHDDPSFLPKKRK